MNRPTIVVSTLCAAALVISAGLTLAGPLDPPAGPVGSTYKSLGDVEPRLAINSLNTPGDADSLFKITKPGSYYLTGNITGVSGKQGIEIDAPGVTVDLCGFDVAGVPGALDGIRVATVQSNISIFNGSLRDWPLDGIDLNNATNTRLRDLSSASNAGVGFRTGSGASIVNCNAYFNGASGFEVGDSSTITACGSRQNTLHGFNLSLATIITDCTAYANHSDGIRLFSSSIARNNMCTINGLDPGSGAGIHALSNDNHIEGNNCTANDRGIEVDNGGNFITRNVCSGNTLNWKVAVTNTILVVQATQAPAVNGNTGGLAPGSTDPNANFTY